MFLFLLICFVAFIAFAFWGNHLDHLKKAAYLRSLSKVNGNHRTYYLTSKRSVDLNKVKRAISSANKTCKVLLGGAKLPHLTIIFYKNVEELDQFTKLQKVGGFYDRANHSINLIHSKSDPQPLYSDMKHEYTHFYFNRLLSEKHLKSSSFPLWFQEGLASYIANPNMNDKGYSHRFISLSELNTTTEWEHARDSNFYPYPESYVAIHQLLERNGNGVIKKILARVAQGEDFYTALDKVSHLSDKQFENDIKDYYVRH